MRRLFFAVSVSFGLGCLPVAAAQRAAAPAVAQVAPAPVHAAPAVRAAAPSHAGSFGATHSSTVRANAHPAVRSSARTSAPAPGSSTKPPVRSAAPTTPPRISWNSSTTGNDLTTTNGGVIVHTAGPFLPTYPPQVPGAPVLLPGDIFSGHSCYAPLNCFPVPGLGFDYDHFFAVHPGWGSQILTAGVVVPFGGGGGFYLPVPYYTPPPVPEEQQAPAENEAANNNGNYNPNGEANYNHNQQMVPQQQSAPPAAQNYYPPSEPVYEYVFVKRDGTKIFAVAYSLTKDKLSYVTKEGLRRTLALDALDFDATRKSNEERGNTVTLPSAPAAAMAMAS